MHSFEVNIRICQPSKVMLTEAKSVVKINKNALSKTHRFFKHCTSRKKVIETEFKKKVKKSHITKQLMHSFEVYIRICQSSKVNSTFSG